MRAPTCDDSRKIFCVPGTRIDLILRVLRRDVIWTDLPQPFRCCDVAEVQRGLQMTDCVECKDEALKRGIHSEKYLGDTLIRVDRPLLRRQFGNRNIKRVIQELQTCRQCRNASSK